MNLTTYCNSNYLFISCLLSCSTFILLGRFFRVFCGGSILTEFEMVCAGGSLGQKGKKKQKMGTRNANRDSQIVVHSDGIMMIQCHLLLFSGPGRR